MLLDPDSYRALARSSPWRWSALHFRHRSSWVGPPGPQVEAWVDRPGRLRVVGADGSEHVATGVPDPVLAAANRTWPTRPDPPRPQDVVPTYRPDGLVAERPSDVDYEDPMWTNYSWVAMLDPVELSHHVDVSDCRDGEVAGRPAWWTRLVALPGYDPRCGGNCCELLYSEVALMADFGGCPDEVPEAWRGRTYPEAYDVALDVQTGIVVRLDPVGGDADAPWLENDIVSVG